MRKAEIYMHNQLAGYLMQDENGYSFFYTEEYLNLPQAQAVSVTLPLTNTTYVSTRLFPFFDGLIPEGWLLAIAEKNWKINPRDRMGLLMACCNDCIGAVHVEAMQEEE